MDIKKITELHADLMSGISVEDLSDKGLLKYGSMLLKQYRQSKSILRKIEIDEVGKTQHWIMIREHCSREIDSVLCELNNRMLTDVETFTDGILLSFTDLVASIRVALFDEDRLDSEDQPQDTSDVSLIFEENE